MGVTLTPTALYVDGKWQSVHPASFEEAVQKIVVILNSSRVAAGIRMLIKVDETRWDEYYYNDYETYFSNGTVRYDCEGVVRDTRETSLRLIIEAPLKDGRYSHRVVELKLSARVNSDYYSDTTETVESQES